MSRYSRRRCPGGGARVGTVDKFQGQEAPIVIYSMATSTADEAPRGMEFLYSLHRLNVATSRARCVAAIVVLLLAGTGCSSPDRPKRCGSWLQLSPSVAASCFATGLGPIDWPAGLEPLEASGAPPPPMPAAREEGGAASATLELLVLWRGTPGWFLRPVFDAGSVTFEGGSAVEVPDGSVSFEDRAVYPRFGPDAPRPDQGGGAPAGRRLGSMVTIRQGGVLLELRFDPQSAVAYVQEQPIRLNGDNVVLVDDVDGPAGPRVVGTLRIDPGFSVGRPDEPPYGFEDLLQRSEELFAFLRCDVPLPADLYPRGRSVSLAQRYMDEACARYGLPPAPGGPPAQ